MSPFKFVFLLIICLMGAALVVDQIFLLAAGNYQQHFLLRSLATNDDIFRFHPRHHFLLEPTTAPAKLSSLATSNSVRDAGDYVLDEQGFRVGKEARANQLRVNVFGDSFAFGLFLRPQESLVYQLSEALPGCHFRDYSVPAFSLSQMMNLSRDQELVPAAQLNLFFYITDDVIRSFRMKDVNRLGRWPDLARLEQITKSERSWASYLTKWSVRHFFLAQVLYRLRLNYLHDHLAYGDTFKKFKADYLTHYPETPTLFVHLPTLEEVFLWRKKPNLWSEDLYPQSPGIQWIKKSEEQIKSYYFTGDGHPRATGVLAMTKELSGFLKSYCSNHHSE